MSLELPHFKSELEEADWWYEHREEVEAEFVIAAAKGQLRQGIGVDQIVVAPIGVNSEDLERAESIMRGTRAREGNLRRAS